MTTYFTLLTPTGLAKIANAQLTQNTVAINQVAVGDSNGVNYTPTGNETALKKERWRGGVASVNIDATNPNWIVIEAVIPSSVGGFTLREVALYDVDGDMIAIGNYPDTYKPLASDGSTMDLVLRTIIEVSNASSITLRIDPNVIVASRKYVDDKFSLVDGKITEHIEQKASKTEYGHMKVGNGLSAIDGVVSVESLSPSTPAVAETGWVPGAGGQYPLSYYKDAFGVVHIDGIMYCQQTSKSLITVLPVGYRPLIECSFNITANIGTGLKNKTITISKNGEVKLSLSQTDDSQYGLFFHYSFRAEGS